jgi:hypothetical protein
MMERRHLLLLLVLVPLLLLARAYLRSEEEPAAKESKEYFCAYQSNDDRVWHIWCHRTVEGVTDTVRVSPDTSSAEARLGYSAPTLLGDGSTLYCAMLVHRQVSGDSAYVMVRKSTDFGATWETIQIIGQSQAIARSLRAECHNGELHLTWEDCRSGYWRIYHEEITDL